MRAGSRFLKARAFRFGFILLTILATSHATVTLGQTVGGGGIRRGLPGAAGDPLDPQQQQEALQKKADEFMQSGLKLRAKGLIQPAKTKFRAVVELVGVTGAGPAAMGQLVSIQQEGNTRLDEARKLFTDGKFGESLKLAKRVKVMYGNILEGLPGAPVSGNLSRMAAKLIEEIDADPRAQEALQEGVASIKAKSLPRLEKEAKRDRSAQYDLYKKLESIAKSYPKCATGRQCAERARQMRADRSLAQLLHREEERRTIASAIQRAEQYEKNGLHDEAAREYRELAQRFPGRSLDELRRMAAKKSSDS
jgi:hypothetical protein